MSPAAAERSPAVRRLTDADAAANRSLGSEAFGAPAFPVAAPEPGTWPPPGHHAYGVHEDGELVAKLVVRDDESWWGGAPLATAGIAGVAVRPEQRGRGLLQPLVDLALREARERGAVVSTLYATAPGVYRRFGYEVVTELLEVELPTASLARIRPPAGVELRRATADDVPATTAVYDAWAAAQNGPLTRRGLCWPTPAEPLGGLLGGATAATVAVEDDRATGYAVWRRPAGYDVDGRLEVSELVARTAAAAHALWAMLGTFVPVAPTARVTTSGADALRLALPGAACQPVVQHPYSLRLLDLPGAFATRGVGPLDVRVPVTVTGDEHVAGDWVVEAEGGRASCTRGDAAGGPTATGAGLAVAWAGAQSCANLRMAGHLSGPTTYDAALDALLGGRQVHVRDYF